ncbi:DUF21 domain-containing protein [Planctomycetota bacterium]
MSMLIWLGIAFCVTQSAMFSGLNLAFFSVSKLRLEIETQKSNPQALRVSQLRETSNFLLVTILWGNVGINVLLTLLSNSVMAGMTAFLFSTVVITFLGEIIPQAYFSRHALKMAAWLSPILRIYQWLLYPVAKPSAMLLDKWLGPEAIQYFRESDFAEMVKMHITSRQSDIEAVEGHGAINFLALDDVLVIDEGEEIAPDSLVALPFEDSQPVFPVIKRTTQDPFLKSLQRSQKKWAVLVDEQGEPRLTLDVHSFLPTILFGDDPVNPRVFCHQPIIVGDDHTKLGEVIPRLKVYPEHSRDDVIDNDLILLWGAAQKRIITGADILGKLLDGIVQNQDVRFHYWKT